MAEAPLGVPVFDNHFHLDPKGRNVEAVKEFHRAGGTHLLIMHKPYGESPRFNRTVQDHRDQMEITLRLANRVRAEVPGVTLWVALSPHPAEFTKMLDAGHPMEEAVAVYRGGLEAAQAFVREGRALAMGEVGRPHYPVSAEVWEAANGLMQYAFELCRDAGCAAVIHSETGTPESFADLASFAKRAGLPLDKTVKHYSPPLVRPELNHGLFPSVLIGKGSAEAALAQGTRFMMETDYMDEPEVQVLPAEGVPEGFAGKKMSRYKLFHEARARGLPRPQEGVHYTLTGAVGEVLGPKTVPRRTRELLEKGLMTPEQAWIVHSENPKRVYGVDVTL